MLKKIVAVYLGTVLVTLALIGCAASTSGKLYQGGVISKSSAETTYQAVYAGHKQGIVSKTDMDNADLYYDQWQKAQTLYIDAASKGQLTPDKSEAVATALMLLQNIAASYGLL